MSNATHSLTMIVPVASADAANAYSEAMTWGSIFTVDLSPDGNLPVTHKACHMFVTAEFVATIEAAKASEDEQLAVLNSVFIHPEESIEPKFNEAIAAHDPVLQRYYPPQQW